MNHDPTIDAIHDVRCQIFTLFDHDARKLVKYYRELQRRHCDKIVFSNENTQCAEAYAHVNTHLDKT